MEQQVKRRNGLSGMVGGLEDHCRRVSEGLAGASFKQKRRLVELLIDRVIGAEVELEILLFAPEPLALLQSHLEARE